MGASKYYQVLLAGTVLYKGSIRTAEIVYDAVRLTLTSCEAVGFSDVKSALPLLLTVCR